MKIKELLNDESKWIKGKMNTDSQGISLPNHDPNVCKWCLLGAVRKCYGDNHDTESEIGQKILQNIPIQYTIAEWNDSPATTFSDIRALVEKLDI